MAESVKKKSLLYKSKVEYANFSINHVLGCAHGCTYPCYALLMAKRFGRIKDYADWLKPKLVDNALELLDQEIPKYRDVIECVHLSFTTDPFMYGHKEVEALTLEIIKKLNENEIKSMILTKGLFPIALIDKQTYGCKNSYGISLVSLSDIFQRRFEPFSAPFQARIDSLQYLCDAGLETWVSIEPYPTPNLFEQDLSEILNAVGFVDRIVFGKLNYNAKVRAFDAAGAFYDKCATDVIDFCSAQNIACHIKNGTLTKNKTTDNLSPKDSRLPLPSY